MTCNGESRWRGSCCRLFVEPVDSLTRVLLVAVVGGGVVDQE